MDLVRSVRIPDDQFPILGSRDQVSFIRRPMHRVDLGQVTFQGSSDSHDYSGKGFDFLRHGFDFE
jgi:hypothetical protein